MPVTRLRKTCNSCSSVNILRQRKNRGFYICGRCGAVMLQPNTEQKTVPLGTPKNLIEIAIRKKGGMPLSTKSR
jgi:ribosomal protein S27AE